MATTTTNYGFNIAEGSDTVNLLTQCYPNFTSIDSILFPIEKSGTTTATVTKAGTVQQIVRVNSRCDMFRFVATANYAAGDTFTVDGASVTATSVSGEALPAGAFVINQSVLCILNGSVLTVLAGGKSDPAASDVSYSNASSGLSATNVQTAIDEVVNAIPTGFDADDITYDNTVSGLTATDVQTAIDEIALGGGGGGTEHGIYELWKNSNLASPFSAQTVTVTVDDTSKYDALIFVIQGYLGDEYGSVWHEIESDYFNFSSPSKFLSMTAFNGGSVFTCTRKITSITTTATTFSIAFGDGYSNTTGNDSYGVPARILGLIHNS